MNGGNYSVDEVITLYDLVNWRNFLKKILKIELNREHDSDKWYHKEVAYHH